MNNFNVKRITYGGLATALVFVATAIIPQIPVPFTEGYIHAGDSMIFVTAILLGWRYGAIAGGLGSAMADLFLGYSHWVIPTLIIKAIMGAIVGYMAQDFKDNKHRLTRNIITILIGGGWMAAGIGLKNLMTVKLADLSNSDFANYLIEDFELGSIDKLMDLIKYVQTSLSISIAAVPIIIALLAIIFRKKDKTVFGVGNLMGMTLAGLWMVIGYYIAGGILKGNMVVSIFSIPSNFIQFIGGMVIAFPLVLALKKTRYFDSVNNKL